MRDSDENQVRMDSKSKKKFIVGRHRSKFEIINWPMVNVGQLLMNILRALKSSFFVVNCEYEDERSIEKNKVFRFMQSQANALNLFRGCKNFPESSEINYGLIFN